MTWEGGGGGGGINSSSFSLAFRKWVRIIDSKRVNGINLSLSVRRSTVESISVSDFHFKYIITLTRNIAYHYIFCADQVTSVFFVDSLYDKLNSLSELTDHG